MQAEWSACQRHLFIHEEAERLHDLALKEEQTNPLHTAIENFILDMLRYLSNDTPPIVQVRRPIWTNISFTDRTILKPKSSAFFTILSFQRNPGELTRVMYLIYQIYRTTKLKSFINKRELYYQNKRLFNGKQQVMNNSLNKVSSLLGFPLWEMGVISCSKGLIAGPLHIITGDNKVIDCTPGVQIPQEVFQEISFETRASYALLVEKNTLYERLLSEKFLDKHKDALIISGKGFPDVNTRLLVQKIHQQLSLPIYALVDPDPYGIEILYTYKFGSLALSHVGERLAAPGVKWLGCHPSDILPLNIPSMPLNQRDKNKLDRLLAREGIQSNQGITDEVKLLKDIGVKAEVDGLFNISPAYLSDVYIPTKFESGRFL